MARGPVSMSTDPDGSLYVLDAEQRHVVQVAGGKVGDTIPIPSTIYPMDLAVVGNTLIVLDTDGSIHRYNLETKSEINRSLRIRGLGGHNVHGLIRI